VGEGSIVPSREMKGSSFNSPSRSSVPRVDQGGLALMIISAHISVQNASDASLGSLVGNTPGGYPSSNSHPPERHESQRIPVLHNSRGFPSKDAAHLGVRNAP
jgi:hypothetical protein